MKRVGLALLISLCLGVGYVGLTTVLLGFVFPDAEWLGPFLAMPLRLPVIVYGYFFPFTDSEKLFVVLLAFVIDIAIYALPIYIVLTLIARRRRSRTVTFTEHPPPLPTFDD